MSTHRLNDRCGACGGTMFLPGKPQEDADGHVIGYRYICAHCGATVWTTPTEEQDAKMEAQARHQQEQEALRQQREAEECRRNRQRHQQMKDWMHEIQEWAKVNPAVDAFLRRQIACYGDMHIWTPAWTYDLTIITYNAARAMMGAMA